MVAGAHATGWLRAHAVAAATARLRGCSGGLRLGRGVPGGEEDEANEMVHAVGVEMARIRAFEQREQGQERHLTPVR